MRYSCAVVLASISACALSAAEVKWPEAKLAIGGLDPVELIAGRETKGSDIIEVERGKYRYVFANDENRKTFLADPERHAIQFGGACMRMGPVAGAGSPERYLVHEKRIYIFASESCRNTFKAAPAKYIDTPDAPAQGTPAEAERAAQLLDKAAEEMGGAEALKNLKSVQVRHKFAYKTGGGVTAYARTGTWRAPASYTVEDDYGTSRSGWELLPEGSRVTWSSQEKAGAEPVEESVRSCMEREMFRQPAVILNAWKQGRAKAFAQGKNKVGEVEIERVAVSVQGATTTLGIDSKSGRILQVAYRGRGATGIGEITKHLGDYRRVSGILMPYELKLAVDGKAVENPAVAVDWVRVNEDAAADATRR